MRNPSKGTASIVGNDVRYVPDANAFGRDTFAYAVSDGHGATDTATVSITITPVNDAPVANNDSATVMDGPAVTIPVMANDNDVDADSLRISTVTQGTRGTVAITGGGTGLTYDPSPLAAGSDTFTYTIHDGHGRTDVATVNVTGYPGRGRTDDHHHDEIAPWPDDRLVDGPRSHLVGGI